MTESEKTEWEHWLCDAQHITIWAKTVLKDTAGTFDCKKLLVGSQRDDKVVTLKLFVQTLIITVVSSGFASSYNQHAGCTNPPRIL